MSEKISAIILAGGQGRRFNYQDKGLVDWQNKPLIANVIDRIKPRVGQIIVSCNRNTRDYQRLGYPVCHDILSGFQGPLAGIQAALPLVKHRLSLICPCDTPALPEHLVTTLLTALMANNADIAYPCTETKSHFLPSLIKSTLLPSLNDYINGTNRSVRGWYSTVKAVSVFFPGAENSFINVNTSDLL